MGYHVLADEVITRHLPDLPPAAIIELVDRLADLAVDPYKGSRPYAHPDDVMRSMPFAGAGIILYAVDEAHQRVTVVDLVWI